MAQNHLVIPQTVQARFGIGAGSKSGNIIVHYLNPSSTPVDINMANAVFNSVKALWTANMAALCPPSTSFYGAFVRDLNSPGQAEFGSTSAAAPGTAPAGELLPRQIAACLTVRTARAGKSFRGRMYWFGFGENANAADNHMAAATKTAIDAFAAGFLTAANVSGLTLGVAHRPTTFDEDTGLPVAPGLGFTTPASTVLCRDNVWDNQRRRAG